MTRQKIEETTVHDNLDKLLDCLPKRVVSVLKNPYKDCKEGGDLQEVDLLVDLLEVVLDLGRKPEVRHPGKNRYICEEPVTQDEIDAVVEAVGDFGGDNRAGIESSLHRISGMRNRRGKVIGLTCRVGRAVYGTAKMVSDLLPSGRSMLLLGRPGCGKTTKMRDIAYMLSEDYGKRVVIVDTSNEIGGDGDIPHPAIGSARRMQVPDPSRQHSVMIEAVENHMPEVIIIDEIGTLAEVEAARTIAERGVQLIATAHGGNIENIIQNPTLNDLVGGISSVTLGDEEAKRRGSQKTVLERKTSPTFDIAIEIQDRYELAVHYDVAEVVDRYLRNREPNPERRVLDNEGYLTRHKVPREDTQAELMEDIPDSFSPDENPYLTRVMVHGLPMSQVENAIKRLRLPLTVTRDLDNADVFMVFAEYQPKKLLAGAKARKVQTVSVGSTSVHKIEKALKYICRK